MHRPRLSTRRPLAWAARHRSRLLAALCALSAVGSAHAAAQRADVIIRHATLVVAGACIVADQAVATRGGSVVAVGPDGSISRAWRAVHAVAGGRFLIPGLGDMHVQFGGGPGLVE